MLAFRTNNNTDMTETGIAPKSSATAGKVHFQVLFLALLMAALTATRATAQSPTTPTGAGTGADPYQINNLSHLAWMTANVSSSFQKVYALMNDIDSSDTVNWEGGAGLNPIGTSASTAFLGTFDGRGHAIINLTINRTNMDNVGLFGYVGDSGVLSNVVLRGVKVSAMGWVAGSLAGVNDGTIVGCRADGQVTMPSGRDAGGLVGYNRWGRTIKESSAAVTVTGMVRHSVGGLIGYNEGPVTHCSAKSRVNGLDSVGGLIGLNHGQVEQCFAAGEVTEGDCVGGLVGHNEYGGRLINCYTVASVKGYSYAGGIVGYNSVSGYAEQCLAAGRVTGDAVTGGLVGEHLDLNEHYGAGYVSNSYWDIETTGQPTSQGDAVTGATTTAMKRRSTFTGWDFENVWTITEDVSYPHFAWANAFNALNVHSAHGQPTPATGTSGHSFGAVITNGVASPVQEGTTQYVCTGWTMSGNEPYCGTGTVFTATITNDARLTWLWRTNYWLDVDAGANGTVNAIDGWMTHAATATVTALPDSLYQFVSWSGTVSGCEISGSSISAPMDYPRHLTAYFAAETTTNNVPKWWLAQHGLTNFATEAMRDGDEDGLLTWQEFVAGSDPTNKSSAWKVQAVGQVDADGFAVGWESVSGRLYTVSRSFDLLATNAGFVIIATNLPATPTWNVYTDQVHNANSRFYRIGVYQPLSEL